MSGTWDSGNKGSNITLSGGNLVATLGSAGAQGVRSTNSVSTGKIYFEIQGGSLANNNTGWGIADGSAPFNSVPNTNDMAIGTAIGSVLVNGSNLGAFDGWVTSSWGEVAVDLTNNKIWVRKNNSANWNNSGSADPATNVGGISIAALSPPFYVYAVLNNSTENVTLNVGDSAFNGTPPTGFSSWSDAAIKNVSVSETLTATSAQNASNQIAASVSESMSAADHPTVSYHLFVNETLHATDHPNRAKVFNKSVSEALHATDKPSQGIRRSVHEGAEANKNTKHPLIKDHVGVTVTRGTHTTVYAGVHEFAHAAATPTVATHADVSVAETLHPLTLISQSTDGTFNVAVHTVASAQDHPASNIKTHSVVAETMHAVESIGEVTTSGAPGGIWNLSVAEILHAVDTDVDPETFTSTGIRFWGYGYAYQRNPSQKLAVWCAGLDCGDHPVDPAGFVFVPWESDPDELFTPAYLMDLSNDPPEGGFGASACNIDLHDNNGGITRVVVDLAIGLPYKSRLQLLRPNTVDENHSNYGSSPGETRRIHQYAAFLTNTGPISVGTTEDNLRPVTFKQPNGNKYLASRLKTGIHHDFVDADYNFDNMLMMQMFRPYPATIVSLTGFMKTFDRE